MKDRKDNLGNQQQNDIQIKANSVNLEERLLSVDFEVEQNQVLTILGPNKAGKSSIAQLLSTMISPESGSIEICGQDLRQLKLSEKGQMFGLVPHFDYLQDEYTVNEHIMQFGFFRGF